MSNYYEKRDAKVRIAHELMNLGWTVLGYKEDESDSMTDYYSPSDWSGIATKNGYVLVVDNKYSNMSGKEITKYNPNYVSMNSADHSKIESLKNMTIENGASEGEQENAQKLIEKLQSKYSNQKESRWEVIGHYPTYMNTTKGSIWHLEKDGALADKGNKLTIFDNMPSNYEFDINTMEFTDRYKKVWTGNDENGCRIMEDRQLNEDERKAVNEFKSFILRIERIVNFGNSCGDGTKETEEAFQQQNENEKMVKKTFTKTKKVIKPVKVERDSVKVGDYVNYKGNRATYCYWKVIDINEERQTFTYEATGKKYQELKNGKRYYNYFSKLDQYDIFELQEVEEIETVEKWVKATTKTTKKETVKAEAVQENKEEVKTTETTPIINNVEFTVSEDIHTKTQEKIFVAKLVERVSKDEFMTILSKIKKLGGYYYKYKGGFIFSEDPIEILKSNFSQSELADQEKNISNDDIESLKNTIIEESGHIIENLNLVKFEYWNNEEYKNKLLQVIKDRNINKNQFKSVIEAIENDIDSKHYTRLIEVLKGFYTLENNNNKDDKEKLINKIDKQLESNNNKIEKLSGDYLTNTWKRMNEQSNRDNQRQALEKDNLILIYIKEKINIGNTSGFEKALITRSLRDDFKSYYRNYMDKVKYNREEDNIYPKINPSWEGSQWNKDIEKRIKRLKEINLNDDIQLKNCLKSDYKEIINSIENKNQESEIEQKIKKLEREYKMQQKGDINFTPKELVNILINYADIKETDHVLEPTAGTGNIADLLKYYTNNIDCIEYMYNYNELLKLKGYNVIGSDFMECTNYNSYEKIIANFPFSREQEMIKHAYKMLKSDGKMVVITSNHWTFANDKESINFREWLNNLDYEVYESDISFEFTNVNYKILIINKDENINSVAV